ncbi:phosphotransferase system, HPr-related protein [Pseudomonas oryziphila]|uniref:Phosphotransferase system, HPr-related protein n=1 Tax=Pseudomonas entomophila TaxID=312306 RepID=A0A3S8UKQ3_9PSED|nr:phosphotransferase system, HPr-related protein [Pseudomonas oryziphila]AZL68985.1 phosphotransferase system, HPr-related protein [Pseudomonas oryziphila]
MSRPDDPRPQIEIDDTEDRMGSVHELDFSERMTGGETLSGSLLEDNVRLDDLGPETLFDETDAWDADEPGTAGGPADMTLRQVEAHEIGGGIGLDEAELARSAPLDGEPWSDDVVPDDDRREP